MWTSSTINWIILRFVLFMLTPGSVKWWRGCDSETARDAAAREAQEVRDTSRSRERSEQRERERRGGRRKRYTLTRKRSSFCVRVREPNLILSQTRRQVPRAQKSKTREKEEREREERNQSQKWVDCYSRCRSRLRTVSLWRKSPARPLTSQCFNLHSKRLKH